MKNMCVERRHKTKGGGEKGISATASVETSKSGADSQIFDHSANIRNNF